MRPDHVPHEGPAVPILPTRDMSATLAFFDRLGFRTDRYDDGYAFVRRDAIELHYILVPEVDPFSTAHSVFVPVGDVDKVHQEFVGKGVPLIASSVEGALADLQRLWESGKSIARITEVEDKPWGMREFILMDPTNNLLRFGHPSER